MSTKGRNQFSHHHPNTEQRLGAARDRAKAKGEIHNQRSGVHMSEAPHFPPGENLPPQAKRIAKKRRAEVKQASVQAIASLEEHSTSGEVPSEDYPDALPREGLIDRAEPVIRDAQGHWTGLLEAAGRFVSEMANLLRTPGFLVRALLKPQKA